MYNNKLLWGILLLTVLLSGCASGVSRTQGPAVAQFHWSSDNPFGNIDLVLTPAGKESIKNNLKFDPDVLKDHVERALIANSMIVEDKQGRMPHLIIEVKDVRVRSNFSAVMWGFMAGNDHITGDVVIKDPLGAELDRFEVSASYALGGLAGGMDSARMGWLYETFAEETLNELTKGNLPERVETTGMAEKDVQEEFTKEDPSAVQNALIQEEITQDAATQIYADGYQPGDTVLIELKDGNNKIVTITSVGENSIAGLYDYQDGAYQVMDKWDRENIIRMRPARINPNKIKSPPRLEDVFKNGDFVILEFKNGDTKEITLTHINERVVAGQYEWSFGKTTPVNYDRRSIKSIRSAEKDTNKKDYKYDL